MSIRNFILAICLFPLLANAGGGIVSAPGGGWPVGVGGASAAIPAWTDSEQSNLVGFWPFDPTVTNAVGLTDDASTSGTHDATNLPNVASGWLWLVTGTNTTGRSVINGRVEHCAYPDGADDGGKVLNGADFNGNFWSLCFWARPLDSAATYNAPLSTYMGSSASGWTILFDKSTRGIAILRREGSVTSIGWGNTYDTNLVWKHYAITYTNGSQVLYTNSVVAGVSNVTWTFGTSTRATLCEEPSGAATYANPWCGPIDDIRFYNKVLSVGAIQDIYTNTTPGNSREGGY